VVWQGQTVNLNLPVVITVIAGAVTWSGQTATTILTVPVSAGSVLWSGQAVNVTRIWVVSPGSVLWQGQTVALVLPGAAGPVRGPTRKSPLAGDDNAVLELTIPVLASILIGDDVDSEELVGAPRAVLIGAGSNSMEEV